MCKKILTLILALVFVLSVSELALGDTSVILQTGPGSHDAWTVQNTGNCTNLARIEQSSAGDQWALIHQKGSGSYDNTAKIWQINNNADDHHAEQYQKDGSRNTAEIRQTDNPHPSFNNTAKQEQLNQDDSIAKIWQTNHSGKNSAEQKQTDYSCDTAKIWQENWSKYNTAEQKQKNEYNSEAKIYQSESSQNNQAYQTQRNGGNNTAKIEQKGDGGSGFGPGVSSYNYAEQIQEGWSNTATILQNSASDAYNNWAEQKQDGNYNIAHVKQEGSSNQCYQIQHNDWNTSNVIQTGNNNIVDSVQNGNGTSTVTQLGNSHYAYVRQ